MWLFICFLLVPYYLKALVVNRSKNNFRSCDQRFLLRSEDALAEASEYFGEHNQTIVLKAAIKFMEKDAEKDAEKDILIHEKEKLMYEKEKEKLMYEKNIEILMNKLKERERELLMSRQAVTSRGIIEYYLKGAQNELSVKGNFNAAAVSLALSNKGIVMNSISLNDSLLRLKDNIYIL